ncbi:MFS transporter [Actinoplanes sp. NPDC051851]|uniref:MFS transporter n=1 Tax=Actinoplanes sp. NPDC051851 TaxID=3154753 RepID=UPI00344AF024
MAANNPWKTAILAGMASYLDAGALVSAGVAVGALYAPALHLSSGAIGAIIGLQTFMFAIGALFGGRLGDRYGRRKVFTLSMVGFAIGALLLTIASSAAMLYAGAIVIGLAIGADLPVSLAMVNEDAPEGKKGKMVAFSQILWLAGILVTVILTAGTAALGATGGRILFGHLLVVSLLVLALRLTMKESAEWTAARSRAASADSVQFKQLGQLFRGPVAATVLAMALYYTTFNLGANTIGQYGSYLWINLTGGTAEGFSIYNLASLPVGLIAGAVFLRIVDTESRRVWFAVAAVLNVVVWALPIALGVTQTTLLVAVFMLGVNGAFCGETIYKVWSQELVPTLLRSTGQGVTIAVARVVAAAFAVVTPGMALSSPNALFGIITAAALVAAVVGIYWIPRLPRATDLETIPTILEKVPV